MGSRGQTVERGAAEKKTSRARETNAGVVARLDMRPSKTRLPLLGLLVVLAVGVPAGASDSWAAARAVGVAAQPTRAELLSQARACQVWFAEAARSSSRDWARDARFAGCREVIADLLAHLEARERAAMAGGGAPRRPPRGELAELFPGLTWSRDPGPSIV